MGDEKHLHRLRQTLKPLADGGGNRTTDAAVYLVEHQHGRRTHLRERNLQREREARELAAGRDFGQRPKRNTLDGSDLEGDAFETVRTGRFFRKRRQGNALSRAALWR
jgi:hypothetical protein